MPRAGGPSKSAFATTPYEPDPQGILRAVLPARCVFARGAEGCLLFVDHYRRRKTGPRFPVAVVGCSVHPEARYTLYPPGHFPYGREAVVPASVSGPVLREAETGRPVWEATAFAAALDAAGGEEWSRESPWEDGRRRRTQGRRLEWLGRLVGVHPGLEEGVRERIATRLGVATLMLRTAARRWTRSWRARGAAVLAVLEALPMDGRLLDRVLAAGGEAALWAPPGRWDPARRTWVPPRSGEAERRANGSPRIRGPPPTNLRRAARGEPDVGSPA